MAPRKKKTVQDAPPSLAPKARPITEPSPNKKTLEVLEVKCATLTSSDLIKKPASKKKKTQVGIEGEENKNSSNKIVRKTGSKASDLKVTKVARPVASGAVVATSSSEQSPSVATIDMSAPDEDAGIKKKKLQGLPKKKAPAKNAIATKKDVTDAAKTELALGADAPASFSLPTEVPEKFPRISKKLTISELRHEAACRGLLEYTLPRLKADLLDILVDGSIHLSQTTAWKKSEEIKSQMQAELKKVEEIKNQMQAERNEHFEKARLERLKAEELLEAKRQKEIEQENAKRQKEIEQENARRVAEIDSQRSLHTSSYPRVHTHPMAKTQSLKINGRERCTISTCSICSTYQGSCIWTCEACDFDICALCFQLENQSDEGRAQALEVARREAQERQKQEQEMQEKWRRVQEEEERENERRFQLRWDATKLFDKAIRDPPEKNKSPSGCNMKGFTVWCSERHSFSPEPAKEFDTTWKTAEEANQRARYLFYWKNCWGVGPHEVSWGSDSEETEVDGLKVFTVDPEDNSSVWTVAVVPDIAFKHLPDATTCRQNYDLQVFSYSHGPCY